jgi:hypothetical protein
MLEKKPAQRAVLNEVMSHPWMVKGFSGPPENHLPHRAPLELPLDMNVINMMTSFDFGNPSEIHDKIKNALSSDDRPTAPSTPKRAPSPYRRRNSSYSSLYKAAQIADVDSPAISSGKDMSEAMISIYYLAREKIEREARNGKGSSHSNAIKSTEPSTSSRRTRSLGEERRESIQVRRVRGGAEGQKEENTEINANNNSTAGLLVASIAGSQVNGSTRPSAAAGLLRRLSNRRRRLPLENPPSAPA